VVVTETLVPSAPVSCATSAVDRWGVRFLLLGCSLLRATVACR
jgi:hypothetical protein